MVNVLGKMKGFIVYEELVEKNALKNLNIPLRRSRDSGVAGATCPEPGATSF